MSDTKPYVKIVFIGDSGVGKSCIISQFSYGRTIEDATPTVGAAYYSKIVDLERCKIELRIWDTAGQETYHSLTPIYFRNSKIAFVVFDVTKRDSFDSVRNWIEQLREHTEKNIVIVIVGNKIDLDKERVIDFNEHSALAEELGALAIETSALTNSGIDRMMQIGLSRLLEMDPKFRFDVNSGKKEPETVLVHKKQWCC